MKIGMRKPSLKKSLKARTTVKWKRQAKRAVIPGYGKKGVGWIKDPKKAIYNKVYNKTTFGISDLTKKKKSQKRKIKSTNTSKSATPKDYKQAGVSLLVIGFILSFIIPPIGTFLVLIGLICLFSVFIVSKFTKPEKVISPQKVSKNENKSSKIIFHDEFLLMGTNYHKKEAEQVANYLSKEEHYFGKTNKELGEYIKKSLRPVYKYNHLKTVEVMLQREPTNPHDKNAVKVLVGDHFVGYLPADIAKRFSSCIGHPRYRYDALLTGKGGPYKTLDLDTNKVLVRKKDLSYHLDLTIWHVK